MSIFSLIAFRNVAKNWKHSLAAIISISAGFISLTLFQGYMVDVENTYNQSFRYRSMHGDLMIENPDLRTKAGRAEPEKYFISLETQKKIAEYFQQKKDLIENSARFIVATGMITNGKNTAIFIAEGFDLPEGARMRQAWEWNTTYGIPLHKIADSQTVTLGQGLGALLGCVPTDPNIVLVQNRGYPAVDRPFHCERNQVQLSATTESGQLNALDLTVAGLTDGGYKEIDERWILTSVQNLQMLMNTDKIKWMTVQLKDSQNTYSFRDDLNKWFKEQGLKEQAIRWQDHPVADVFQKTMSLLQIFKVFIVVVIVTISGLSVLNTMIKTVRERTKEIGTLRSIGYRATQVRQIFSFEALYLSLLGVGLGAILAASLTFAINSMRIIYKAGMLSQPIEFRIAYDFPTYVQSCILLMTLSVLTSFLACRNVVKSRVAENLTYA